MLTERWVGVKRFLGVFLAAIILGVGYGFQKVKVDHKHGLMRNLPFKITEVSKQTGVVNTHETHHRREIGAIERFITSTSASVVVVDYDNDGWPDIFVNNSIAGSRNRLFHNNHDGTFTDVAERAGIAYNKRNADRVIFFDFDNDGYKDMLVDANPLQLYRNNGDGTFTDVTEKVGLVNIESNMYVPFAFDFNNDGYLDLILAAKWPSTDNLPNDQKMNIMPNSMYDSTNGGPVFVYENLQGHGFRKVPDSLGFHHLAFARAVGAYDIRGTGRQDVWFADDFATDKLYLNQGGGKFIDASNDIATYDFSRNGMNVEMADLDNDGHPVNFVSHIYEPGEHTAGNALWKWIGDDRFRNIARQRGVERCGWAWAGKFIDLDNDGHLDLVVGNGFISQNPNKSYWYAMDVVYSSDRKFADSLTSWPPLGDASLSGYEQACVFYNDGTGHFIDVTSATAWNRDLSDERGIAAIDFLNNGSQSLIVVNEGQPLKFYRVDQLNSNKWIGFKLIGTKSNRDALGAEMKVTLTSGMTLSRQLQPMNTFNAQSDERLHFGLGPDPTIQSIELLWPSGVRQKFSGSQFALNQYHRIVEPQ